MAAFNFTLKLNGLKQASRPFNLLEQLRKKNFSKSPPRGFNFGKKLNPDRPGLVGTPQDKQSKTSTLRTPLPRQSLKMPFNDVLYRPWNPKTNQDFETGPCGGVCHSYLALDECDGFTVWNCCHGHWIMPRERLISEAEGHPHENCGGYCSTHPLLDKAAIAFRAQEDAGMTWGDIAEADYRAEIAAETPQQMAMRLKAEAEAEANANAGIVRYSINKKADKWTKGGEMKFRVPRPCKYQSLFMARTCAGCNSHVPEGQTRCQATKGHRVCGEELAGCWAHEKSHTCIYIHPDEPQWADALSGNLCYDRDRSCFHLKGDAPEAKEAPRDFRSLLGKREGNSHNQGSSRRGRC